MTPSVLMYCISGPAWWRGADPGERILYEHTLRQRKSECLNAFVFDQRYGPNAHRPWSWWRDRKGYRCVAVEVRVMYPKDE